MRPSASLAPTAASRVGSAITSIPAAAMRTPPMPKSRSSPRSSCSARHTVAPCRSPDASPAESMIETGSAVLIDAHQRDAGGIRQADDLLVVDEEEFAVLDPERRRSTLGHRLD